jgi:hypothetical protein
MNREAEDRVFRTARRPVACRAAAGRPARSAEAVAPKSVPPPLKVGPAPPINPSSNHLRKDARGSP